MIRIYKIFLSVILSIMIPSQVYATGLEAKYQKLVKYDQQHKGQQSLSMQANLYKDYKALANQGHGCAHNALTGYYWTGNVTSQKFDKVFSLATKALKLGCKDALATLGATYRYGVGVEINLNTAIEYYKKSAKHKNIYSIQQLVSIYKDTNKKDLMEAYHWLNELAKLGDKKAKEELKNCTFNGFFCEENMDKHF